MLKLLVALILVRVTLLAALAVPASCLPNARLAGERLTLEVADPEPVPDKPRGRAPGEAFVAIVSAPETGRETVGRNVTLNWQLTPGPKEEGQLFACEKSALGVTLVRETA